MEHNYQSPLIDAPLRLRVGVTGHRDVALANVDKAALELAVVRVLTHLTQCVSNPLATGAVSGAGASAQLQLTSALAEGADRLMAQYALQAGWRLHVLLPFSAESYKQDFASPASHQMFDRLYAAAQAVTELAFDRTTARLEGYVAVGKMLAKNSDILIALWDGKPSRGAGGTGHVVEMASHQGVPVVWISATDDVQIRCITNTGHIVQQEWRRWLTNYIDRTKCLTL